MQPAMVFAVSLFICSLAGTNSIATDADVVVQEHPVAKVIKLLKNLRSKAVAESKDEADLYSKFSYWCSGNLDEVNDNIAEENEKLDVLKDEISGHTRQVASLSSTITDLLEEIKEKDVSAMNAARVRASAAKLYKANYVDIQKTISAVNSAMKATSSAETSTEAKMMLVQRHVRELLALVSFKAPLEQLSALQEFAKPLAQGDSAKHVDKYDFKSENVIELLKQLKIQFQDKMVASTKAETNSLNSYALEKEARDNAKAAAVKSKSDASNELASTKRSLSEAEFSQKTEKSNLEGDTKRKATTQASCSKKKSEWEERSKTRTLELSAFDAATEILAKATGLSTKAPSNPMAPVSPPLKLVQLGDSSLPSSDPKMRAIALLREAAKNTHSQALERLAVAASAHLGGTFDDVKPMVQKMIFRLMAEQTDEDKHKLWCDLELSKTDASKEDKSDDVEELKVNVMKQTTAVAELTSEIKETQEKVSKINTFMKEATEIRNTGKKENKLALKDSNDGQKAISNAIAVLENFYKESGESSADISPKLSKQPSTWGSKYSNVADPNAQPSGIITVLATINADFAQMAAKTKAQEANDQKDFDDAMKANKIEKARLSQQDSMKTGEKARRSNERISLESRKKLTQGALDSTKQYLKDLNSACVSGDSTYTERKANRAKEIKALKAALTTLADAFNAKGKGSKFLQIARHN